MKQKNTKIKRKQHKVDLFSFALCKTNLFAKVTVHTLQQAPKKMKQKWNSEWISFCGLVKCLLTLIGMSVHKRYFVSIKIDGEKKVCTKLHFILFDSLLW